MTNIVNSVITTKTMLASVAVAITIMNAAVAKDDHFRLPTRPRQYSEQRTMATQAPVAGSFAEWVRGAKWASPSMIQAGMAQEQ